MKALNLSPKESLIKAVNAVHSYAALLFIIFVIVIYGFLTWRIAYYSQLEPSQTDVMTELKTAGVPNVNPEVIKKIEQLKDNSVTVQALFDQARDNPFQE